MLPRIAIDHSQLLRGDKVTSSKTLVSDNGQYKCHVNNSGDLVVEQIGSNNITPNKPIKVIVKGKGASNNHLILQEGDGNLCYYTEEIQFIWCAPGALGGARLKLTNDGTLVLYDRNAKEKWVSE